MFNIGSADSTVFVDKIKVVRGELLAKVSVDRNTVSTAVEVGIKRGIRMSRLSRILIRDGIQ